MRNELFCLKIIKTFTTQAFISLLCFRWIIAFDLIIDYLEKLITEFGIYFHTDVLLLRKRRSPILNNTRYFAVSEFKQRHFRIPFFLA